MRAHNLWVRDLATKAETQLTTDGIQNFAYATNDAGWERSDISAISAASVVMENVIAFEIARAFLEKFGGDSLTEVRSNYESFLATARKLPLT